MFAVLKPAGVAMLGLWLTGCGVAKYQPNLQGKPQANLYIDGRKTYDPWLARIELVADVYDFSQCSEVKFTGRIEGETGKLTGPVPIPAGKHLHIKFIHLVDHGQSGSLQTNYPFAFVPEPNTDYYVGLDTMDKGFKDFGMKKKKASGAMTDVALKEWNICHKN